MLSFGEIYNIYYNKQRATKNTFSSLFSFYLLNSNQTLKLRRHEKIWYNKMKLRNLRFF